MKNTLWNEPITVKRGDIFKLGNHRLMCGDATNTYDVAKLMNGEIAKLLLTDPPYNVKVQYGKNINDNMSQLEYESFNRAWFTLWQSVSHYQIVTPGGVNLISWLRWFDVYHCAPWTKTNAMTAGKTTYFWGWEPILFFGSKWKRKRGNDVFNYPVTTQKNIGNHPCPKPLKLWLDLVENYSNENDLIIDAFNGSGTTIIAAENLHRRCYSMELEPKYCEETIHRWQETIGLNAELEAA